MTTLNQAFAGEGIAAARRVVASAPTDLSSQAMIRALRRTREVTEWARDDWKEASEEIAKGAASHEAKKLVESALPILRSGIELLKSVLELANGPPESELLRSEIGKTRASCAAMIRLAEEAEGILELLSRPRKPRTAEDRAVALASFEAGTYRDAEDVLRERGKL